MCNNKNTGAGTIKRSATNDRPTSYKKQKRRNEVGDEKIDHINDVLKKN